LTGYGREALIPANGFMDFIRDHLQCSRRRFLGMAATAGAGILVSRPAHGQPGPETAVPPPAIAPLVDPYEGSIPLVFPLARGTYRRPVFDTWHDARDGRLYRWTHRNDDGRRAHDGVDLFPRRGAQLPIVYAPLVATVSAVCYRPANRTDAPLTYRVDASDPPPWDFSRAIDDVAGLPLYGNFAWLHSIEAASMGYWIFVCHLQNERALRSLRPGRIVTTETPIGIMGDTGNAAGEPQLHLEIHYPLRRGYVCRMCAPDRRVTAINAAPSLMRALRR
jgi:murein DD-endopeptidase MepM/ murein hydrolase activator NlpD